MATVISNKKITEGIGLLEVESTLGGRPGQFYMLRAWNHYPLLSRPISIYDADDNSVRFLYQVVGEGTKRFLELKPGDDIHIEGPFGNGFPDVSGSVALVGGGIGIAPFYYFAKTLSHADLYLGFSKEPYLVEDYRQVSRELYVQVGGSILEQVDFEKYDTVIACGPHGMLKAVQQMQEKIGRANHVYVSLENKMACGIGACLVCSVKCKNSRKKACTDGPVFPVEEVLFHD
ncbi:dihydroorotate dehydrogenase electron transfer subunit [Paenibacillus dakarensis]|uniref:dihydroorotate dehydrogenase electron transfer subunit n=1 Tax=Paenibacillus dakarensis TaxID=1527293 RepID=UPI0006D54055|nr:dihydroorotate dehydrogenase electron transfer subunit [Paenibacillus dakarensis]